MAVARTERTFNSANIGLFIRRYRAFISTIGQSIEGLRGIPLLHAIKRTQLDFGYQRPVTLFEASNRIMSDLVILYGVKAMLQDRSRFPFDSYTVELGNEDNNGFDITAEGNGKRLVGEAFNVAESHYQGKKGHALQKLRKKGSGADYRVIIANDDSVEAGYRPNIEVNEFFIFVNVETGRARVITSQPGPRRRAATHR